MTARRHGHGAARAAAGRMGTVIIGYGDGHPVFADNPKCGNRRDRRSAAGITRGVDG